MIRTRVPPATPTRTGLIEVTWNGPVDGKVSRPPPDGGGVVPGVGAGVPSPAGPSPGPVFGLAWTVHYDLC